MDHANNLAPEEGLQRTQQRDLARMLTELANLYPSREAVDRFRSKWPDFLPATPAQYLTYIKVEFPD